MSTEYRRPEVRGGAPAGDRGAGRTEAAGLGDLGPRILVAVPAAALTVLLTLQGGALFALALALLGAGAAHELARMLGARTTLPAAVAGAAAIPLAAYVGGLTGVVLAFVLSLPLAFALASRNPAQASRAIAAGVLGVAWIGVALGHGVLVRQLPDGHVLVLAALIGTFLGDTAAHLVGASFGRTPLAPRLSPNKTVEGLLAGLAGGTGSVWLFLALVDGPVRGWSAVLLGLAVASAAVVGDLFESLFKRDLGVKDTGRAFGPHGGILDRIDAVLFAAVATYYVSLLLL
jgi:phosphatidate cytidylyltransferase